MASEGSDATLPPGVRENIDTVVELEDAMARPQGPGEHVIDAVSRSIGKVWFAAFQIAMVMTWIALNSRQLNMLGIDPFPFPLLGLAVSVEAVLLTVFVLIAQNRAARLADRRAHLNLQITLLTERETTKVIQMLSRISDQLQIKEHAEDREAQEMGQMTAVDDVARDLHERLPAEGY